MSEQDKLQQEQPDQPAPERKPKRRIFHKNNPLMLGLSESHIKGEFTDTKIVLREGVNIGPKGHEEMGNVLLFERLQQGDFEALCLREKADPVDGRALTKCVVGLSDEALEAIYNILRIRFEGHKPNRPKHTFEDQELQNFIDTWPENLGDEGLTEWLNDLELPMPQYMMAIDYYKKLGPYGK